MSLRSALICMAVAVAACLGSFYLGAWSIAQPEWWGFANVMVAILLGLAGVVGILSCLGPVMDGFADRREAALEAVRKAELEELLR